jgi:hypothetical protein
MSLLTIRIIKNEIQIEIRAEISWISLQLFWPKTGNTVNPDLQFFDQSFPHILRLAKTAYLH